MKRLKMLGCLSFLWVVAFISMVQCAAMGKNSNGVNSTVFLGEDDEDFVPYQGERFSVFDWMLFRAMAKRYSGNVLISPISIKMALVLLYEGAQDQTAHELANVMQLPASRPATRDKFTGILRSLQKPSSEYALDIGTRIYVDNNITTRQRYAAIVKSFYGTDLVHVNLSDTHLVSEKVNSWVKNVTRERITKLIDNEESLKDSVMLIVNALFFKGTWRRHIFSPNNTHIRKFYTGKSESLDVPFMNVITRLYYSECPELDARILRLPYEGHKFAMYILLPNTLNGIDLLIKRVNPFLLVRYTWLMQDLPVEVSIPKFKFDYSSHLEPSLRELGIRDIFDDTATLTGIAKTKRASKHLIVSDVIQKTGVEVNEQGTTAYAASGIQIGNKIVEQTFIADHPFVFFIEDESTGTILYTGKISNPLQREGSTGNVKVDLASRFSEETTVPTSVIPAVPNADERYNFFNVDLLQAINEQNDGNVIVSPASAKLALTILLEGARGLTQKQLLAALRLPDDVETMRIIAQRTFMPLKNIRNGTEIDVTSRLWAASGLRIVDNYNTILKQYYGGDIQTVDFNNSQNAAKIINDWVKIATRNKIESITEPGSLNSDTRLILTSALYFKGKWLKSFDKKATYVQCFNVPGQGCQNINFMQNIGVYRYAFIPSLNAKVIEIPYSDGKTSMIVLLPNDEQTDQNLQILSKDLSYVPMSALLANLKTSEVILIFPKFSIESKLDLRPALEHMGIQDVFRTTANLSRIISDEPLHVSTILQNAKIEVDEEGTIAAAVTEISIVPLMGITLPIFRANRPFIFAIVDLQTNGTLFAGRFIRPNMSL